MRRLVVAPTVRGELVLRQWERERLVSEERFRNAFTNAYSAFWAKVLAGTNVANLTLTHISLGAAGVQVSTCESAAGWAAAPTVDFATYREGTASLKGASAASTSTAYVNAATVASSDVSATGTSIELQLRLLARANVDLAASELRIYTSPTAYWKVSFATIETISGPFADATWKLCRIATSAFSVGAGVPSWSTVVGVGVLVAANASGTATINWDDIRSYPFSIDVGSTSTSIPNERVKTAFTSLLDLGGGQARAKVFWPTTQTVGTFYVAGLYGNAGLTLAAIVPITLAKLPTLSLTAEWTITAIGG